MCCCGQKMWQYIYSISWLSVWPTETKLTGAQPYKNPIYNKNKTQNAPVPPTEPDTDCPDLSWYDKSK